jgi:hypothetical protein
MRQAGGLPFAGLAKGGSGCCLCINSGANIQNVLASDRLRRYAFSDHTANSLPFGSVK